MEKFIPYEKLSKKKQRELNAARRGTWTINPVTRKPANPKAYNRKTARNWKDDSNSVPFGYLCFSVITGNSIGRTISGNLFQLKNSIKEQRTKHIRIQQLSHR